jgi:hypothetical protein
MGTQAQSPLPAFNGDSKLQSGDGWPLEAAFEARVVSVLRSLSRPLIDQRFHRHWADLLAAGVANWAKCLLNSSFTSSKCHPEAIVLVVALNKPTLFHLQRLQQLLIGRTDRQS